MGDDEIYGYQHRLELVLIGPHGIKESKDILEANKKMLLDYHTFLKTRRLSLPRQEKLMKALKRLAELLGSKQFKDVTREDMEKLIGNMKPKRKGSSSKELADSSLRDFQIIVRQFYSWLYHSPKRQYPDIVSWIEPKEPKPKLQASDLLTQEEKDRLKAATPNLRDKALISCFDEAGPRPGELLNVKLKNVRTESTCAEIDVDGKTGLRVVHIIRAFSDLVNWLDATSFSKVSGNQRVFGLESKIMLRKGNDDISRMNSLGLSSSNLFNWANASSAMLDKSTLTFDTFGFLKSLDTIFSPYKLVSIHNGGITVTEFKAVERSLEEP